MSITWLRKKVYELGFRPQFGTILYSPSLDWMYAGDSIAEAIHDGLEKGYAAVAKDIEMGIGNEETDPQKVLDEIERVVHGHDWFEENKVAKANREAAIFFCPLCGMSLAFSIDTLLFECSGLEMNHGYFDVSMGRKSDGDIEMILKSVKIRG